VVQPLAVVVELLHTLVAMAAVLGANGPHGLAGVADVEDGVVHVAVIPPGRRVTNLYEKGEGHSSLLVNQLIHYLLSQESNGLHL